MVIPSDTGWEPDGAGGAPVAPGSWPIDEEPIVVLDAGALLLPLLGVGAVLMAAYMLETKSAADEGDEVDEDITTEEILPDDGLPDGSEFDDYDDYDDEEDDDE